MRGEREVNCMLIQNFPRISVFTFKSESNILIKFLQRPFDQMCIFRSRKRKNFPKQKLKKANTHTCSVARDVEMGIPNI